MRLGVLVVACALLAAGCGVSISEVNGRPEKYYQKKVSLTGRVARTQSFPAEALLEVVDTRGGRILVHSRKPIEVAIGDWVEVEGVLVPETRVADVVLYDVLVAEDIEETRAPRLRNLM
jgi:hypothetical protein